MEAAEREPEHSKQPHHFSTRDMLCIGTPLGSGHLWWKSSASTQKHPWPFERQTWLNTSASAAGQNHHLSKWPTDTSWAQALEAHTCEEKKNKKKKEKKENKPRRIRRNFTAELLLPSAEAAWESASWPNHVNTVVHMEWEGVCSQLQTGKAAEKKHFRWSYASRKDGSDEEFHADQWSKF